jgi:hypothetical protein
MTTSWGCGFASSRRGQTKTQGIRKRPRKTTSQVTGRRWTRCQWSCGRQGLSNTLNCRGYPFCLVLVFSCLLLFREVPTDKLTTFFACGISRSRRTKASRCWNTFLPCETICTFVNSVPHSKSDPMPCRSRHNPRKECGMTNGKKNRHMTMLWAEGESYDFFNRDKSQVFRTVYPLAAAVAVAICMQACSASVKCRKHDRAKKNTASAAVMVHYGAGGTVRSW